MLRAVRTVALVLIGLAGCVGGCGKDKAKTPADAVVNFARSVEKGDKELFLRSLDFPKQDKDFAAAVFDALVAMQEFGKEMERAYGRDAKGKMVSRGLLAIDLPSCEEVAEGTVIQKMEGDNATALLPGRPDPIHLIRVGGAWKVKLSELHVVSTWEGAAEKAQAAIVALREHKGRIGQPGVTADRIMDALSAAFPAGAQKGAGGRRAP